MACRNMTDAEIVELKGLLDEHERSIEQSDGREYFQHEGDFDFHYRIIQGSQNQRLMVARWQTCWIWLATLASRLSAFAS